MPEIKEGTKYVYGESFLDNDDKPKTKATDKHEVFIKVKDQQEADKLIDRLRKEKPNYVFGAVTIGSSLVVMGKVKHE